MGRHCRGAATGWSGAVVGGRGDWDNTFWIFFYYSSPETVGIEARPLQALSPQALPRNPQSPMLVSFLYSLLGSVSVSSAYSYSISTCSSIVNLVMGTQYQGHRDTSRTVGDIVFLGNQGTQLKYLDTRLLFELYSPLITHRNELEKGVPGH